jgi:putative membrane protein
MIEYIGIILLGVVIGVFTGLIPGIHPNTVIFGSMPFYFYSDVAFLSYLSLIAGLSVSHTFHDFLPAIFLSAPEADAALSSIPGTEMASDGRGIEAFYYTVGGGVFSVLTCIVLAPILFMTLKSIYGFFEPFMAYILLFFLVFMIVDANSVLSAAPVALLAGVLGVLSFRMPINQQYLLLPVFTGLFAVPAVIRTMEERDSLPEQFEPEIETETAARGGFLGFVAGIIAGVFPGLGAAASTSFLSPLMNDSEKEFLAGMGGVNTTDILMSFFAVYILGKARSGASVALKSLSQIQAPEVFFLMGGSILAVSVSAPLSLRVSGNFVFLLEKIRIKPILVLVLIIILASTVYLTGLQGVLILFTAASIGYASILAGERKLCMAVLLVPSIIFFSGSGMFI